MKTLKIFDMIFRRVPTVSVLMPICNINPKLLRATIQSVLNQTFTDFEFLIISDSPDNHELDRLVQSFDDRRIRYYKNKKNLGVTKTRNKLIDLARGKYLAVHDHDDESMPNRFELSVKYLDEHPNVGVVSGDRLVNGTEHPLSHYPNYNLDIKMQFFEVLGFIHPAAMIRASVLHRTGIRYEQGYAPADDYQLFVRLMEFTEFYNFPVFFINYTSHEQNITKTQWQRINDAAEEIKFQIRNKFPFAAMQIYLAPQIAELKNTCDRIEKELMELKSIR